MSGRELISWRQGSILSPEASAELDLLEAEEANVRYVVATHDCDIQSSGEDQIELLQARIVEAAKGDCLNGKNPRMLHVRQAPNCVLAIEMRQRHFVPKEHLLQFLPAEELEAKQRSQFGRWLSLRYSRAPFPDSVNNRLKKAKTIAIENITAQRPAATIGRDRNLSKSLLKVFENDGDEIEGIYVSLAGNETKELIPADRYQMRIFVVSTSRGVGGEEGQAKLAATVAEKLRNLFDFAEWDIAFGSIELLACSGVTEVDFSYYLSRRTMRWNLDFLSPDEP
jgi:hypothetical protein